MIKGVQTVKLWSKEALVLGGIYSVLDTPFSLLGAEMISYGLFWLFMGSALMLCFNKTPKYLSLLITGYPQTSYYLASFGWVPYVMLFTTIAFLGSSYLITYTENFAVSFLYSIVYVGLVLALISLIITFIKTRQNK